MGSERRVRWSDQSGSVLVLMPAAVIVLLVLGSLALDRALVFGAQRDLVATAQAAANDAVAAGVDPDGLRGDGIVVLDPERVGRAVHRVAAGAGPGVRAAWTIQGTSVIVRLERDLPYLLSPAVPGGPRSQHLAARARADLRRR